MLLSDLGDSNVSDDALFDEPIKKLGFLKKKQLNTY